MEELKPCPFCGSDEVGCWMSSSLFPNGKNPHHVQCDNCFARTDYYCTEEEAIAAWNKRVNRCQDCLVDRMIDDGK